jgi:hypothetical protein
MAVDPAYDMPFPYYIAPGSFGAGQAVPTAGPFDAPLVQLPCVNAEWQRIILGCIDQLRNWPNFGNLTPSAAIAALGQVEALRVAMAGSGACCVPTELRLQNCVLQSSQDGGSTWTDVTNWASGFPSCVQSNIPSPVPLLPPGQTTSQHACNIAGFIARQICQESMTQAVSSLNNNLDGLHYAQSVLATFGWAFPLTTAALDALAVVYQAYADIERSLLTAASVDESLFSAVTCAIYGVIASHGYIDATNFASVATAIGAVSYGTPGVISAIHDYFVNLGEPNIRNAENAGALVDEDCSGCAGPWCNELDFTTNGGPFSPAIAGYGHWVNGTGWVGDSIPANGDVELFLVANTSPAQQWTGINLRYKTTGPQGGTPSLVQTVVSGGVTFNHHFDPGAFPAGNEVRYAFPAVGVDTFYIWITATAGSSIVATLLQNSGLPPVPAGIIPCTTP